MEIGKILKEKRMEYELTQEQLSKKIFVSKKTISNWENGKTTPDIDSLIRLTNLFNLSLDNILLEGSEIVENVKKESHLKNLKKYYINTIITLFSIIFIYITQGIFGELSTFVKIILGIGCLSNINIIVYFMDELNKAENESAEKTNKKLKKSMILSLTGIIILIIVSLIFTYFL